MGTVEVLHHCPLLWVVTHCLLHSLLSVWIPPPPHLHTAEGLRTFVQHMVALPSQPRWPVHPACVMYPWAPPNAGMPAGRLIKMQTTPRKRSEVRQVHFRGAGNSARTYDHDPASAVEAGHSAARGTSERLRAVLDAGEPDYSGGATDASVRLSHLLKVWLSLSP